MKTNHVVILEKCGPRRETASSKALRQELEGYIIGKRKKVV